MSNTNQDIKELAAANILFKISSDEKLQKENLSWKKILHFTAEQSVILIIQCFMRQKQF